MPWLGSLQTQTSCACASPALRTMRAAKLENAAAPPLKGTRGDRAHRFRQSVAVGANERSCLIRGAPASLEDQFRSL